jgi:hypothetical protein
MAALTGTDVTADKTVAAFARDAVIGIADLAARSLGGAGGGGGQPPDALRADGAAPPADPLLDLRLPEAVRTWLTPAANMLGLTIEDGTARDKYGRIERRVTYLTNGELRRTLLHISPKVLTDASAYASLGMVMWAIEENAFVAVFAQGLPAPVPVNANVIDDLWKRRPMDSRFIAWDFVSELPSLALEDQVEFMRKRLGLETYKPRTKGAAAGPGKISSEDIVRIVSILSALGYDDARARKTLLNEAELSDFASSIDLVGSTSDVGSELILKLTRYRDSVPPGHQTAIGAFLRTVMGLQDIPPSDATWLNVLIMRLEL